MFMTDFLLAQLNLQMMDDTVIKRATNYEIIASEE